MEKINQSLNALTSIRRELSSPSSIWRLARRLKNSVRSLDINASNESLLLSALPGLYYFEAKFDFYTFDELEAFGCSWGKIRQPNLPTGIPRYYPSRAKHHELRIQRNSFIPFYLGKREDISNRIINHLDGSEESGTYSLKLRSRPELIENVDFRYSYYVFNIPRESYYGVEILEAELRKILNPIVGKQ